MKYDFFAEDLDVIPGNSKQEFAALNLFSVFLSFFSFRLSTHLKLTELIKKHMFSTNRKHRVNRPPLILVHSFLVQNYQF